MWDRSDACCFWGFCICKEPEILLHLTTTFEYSISGKAFKKNKQFSDGTAVALVVDRPLFIKVF